MCSVYFGTLVTNATLLAYGWSWLGTLLNADDPIPVLHSSMLSLLKRTTWKLYCIHLVTLSSCIGMSGRACMCVYHISMYSTHAERSATCATLGFLCSLCIGKCH